MTTPESTPDLRDDVDDVDDVDAVLSAARRRAQALVGADADALRALMHPELAWTTFTGAVLDRDDYITGNTEGGLVWRSQELMDPRVTVVGDTAVLTATVQDEVTREGQNLSFRLRLTQTWVRTPVGWQCLAGHASSATDSTTQAPHAVR